MSDDKLTKDDLSEYLQKFQRLQRLCMGCNCFEVSIAGSSVIIRYPEYDVLVLSAGFGREFAARRYKELLDLLKQDNWL